MYGIDFILSESHYSAAAFPC